MSNSGRVIFITGFKGGVGKTTVTANIASALKAMEKRVLIIDGDFGMRCMDIVLGYENDTVFNCFDVLLGRCEPESAITGEEGLYFMPAPLNYNKEEIPTGRFIELFAQLRKRFDYCLIDSSADPSPYYLSFAAAADDAIVVTLHQSTAIRASEKTALKLTEMGFKNLRLVVNGYHAEYAQKNKLPSILDIINRSAISLLGVVPFEDSLPCDQESGYLAFTGQYDKKIKRYEAAFFNIAKRICGERVPLFEDVYKPKRKKHYLKK
ncbi:MAG: AAA family ATPase [Eubacteriales bacterium]|nr:AAA family ATPase [Eubacteriales bacterium]MDD4421418.1 AAA family ATPase [Eubacteriales bacterium]